MPWEWTQMDIMMTQAIYNVGGAVLWELLREPWEGAG